MPSPTGVHALCALRPSPVLASTFQSAATGRSNVTFAYSAKPVSDVTRTMESAPICTAAFSAAAFIPAAARMINFK